MQLTKRLISPPAVETAAPKSAVASVRVHTASTGAPRVKCHVKSSRTCSTSCGDGCCVLRGEGDLIGGVGASPGGARRGELRRSRGGLIS